MARFNVYPDLSGRGYLLNIQADALDHLATRVVIPLLPLDDLVRPADRLNPVFEIEGIQFIMVTQSMAAVPLKVLKRSVFSLSDHSDEIVAAIDLLLRGF
ncbi:CcdB family protein [Paraburkholderia acidipaludis]|uniref:CcdB family protein n=1 Tax=Paraburkholderia acidipaludis TaxID=660537 RepID=UPI000480949E|nr:CcdB family protein [Paraburkholderia acidipaludis]